MPALKLAKDLKAGDRVLVTMDHKDAVLTVLGMVESVQTVRRKVLMLTLRGRDGRDIHRQYSQYKTVRVEPTERSE